MQLNIAMFKKLNPEFSTEKKVKIKRVLSSPVITVPPSDDSTLRFLNFLSFDGWVSRQELIKLTGYSPSTVTKLVAFLFKGGKIIKNHKNTGGNRPVFFQKVKV